MAIYPALSEFACSMGLMVVGVESNTIVSPQWNALQSVRMSRFRIQLCVVNCGVGMWIVDKMNDGAHVLACARIIMLS